MDRWQWINRHPKKEIFYSNAYLKKWTVGSESKKNTYDACPLSITHTFEIWLEKFFVTICIFEHKNWITNFNKYFDALSNSCYRSI